MQVLFTTGTTAIDVVQSVAVIVGMPASVSVASANTAFYVQLGILNLTGNTVQVYQPVNPAGPLQVSLTNSNATVAQLVTTGGSGAQATVTVPVGLSNSPTSKAAGGVEFDPLATGITTLSTSVTGFYNSWPGAPLIVTVTP